MQILSFLHRQLPYGHGESASGLFWEKCHGIVSDSFRDTAALFDFVIGSLDAWRLCNLLTDDPSAPQKPHGCMQNAADSGSM